MRPLKSGWLLEKHASCAVRKRLIPRSSVPRRNDLCPGGITKGGVDRYDSARSTFVPFWEGVPTVDVMFNLFAHEVRPAHKLGSGYRHIRFQIGLQRTRADFNFR
jgi:hypothetical protein